MATTTKAQFAICPCCRVSFELTPETTLPTASQKWKSYSKADPASVSVADLADNPESYDFED